MYHRQTTKRKAHPMLTNSERKILIRRSKELRDERDAINDTIKGYEQDKRDTIAELETMLHLLERDALAHNGCEKGGSDNAT